MMALLLTSSLAFIPSSRVHLPPVQSIETSLQSQPIFNPVESSTAADMIFPFFSRIIIKPSDARKVALALRKDYSDLTEIIVYSLLGFFVPFLGKYLRLKIIGDSSHEEKPYGKSKTYHIMNHISQGFRIGALVNICELVAEGFSWNGKSLDVIISAISTTLFTIWAMFRIMALKNIALAILFDRFLHIKAKSQRLTKLTRKISDYSIYIGTVFIVCKSLGINCGAALNALFAFGGAGTLTLSLASKDILKQFLSGISLSLLDSFEVGDKIITNGGSLGTVEKIGAYNTLIRGDDEILMKIPNAEISTKNISNLSMINKSQVKQSLRIDHSAIDTIPLLIEEIKAEIKSSCPMLVCDPSHPFRVHWTEYGKGFLQIDVDAKFNVEPHSDDYYDNKQRVLLAISRAIKKCGVKLC